VLGGPQSQYASDGQQKQHTLFNKILLSLLLDIIQKLAYLKITKLDL
jgi:hypothetical protein